jgi:uncharacterized protein YgiM (DUF1202 family)
VGWALLLLVLASLACNAFAGRVEPGLPPPPNPTAQPVVTATAGGPGLAPTATLPAGPPETVEGTIRILVDLNIRSGPGVEYDRVGFLRQGDRAAALARDPESGWWRIECPPQADGAVCWVSGGAQYTRLESDD